MKKVFMLSVLAFVVFGLSSAQAENVSASEFLLKNYGWTFLLPQEKPANISTSFDSPNFAWNIVCDSSRQILPKEGESDQFGWVCVQKDTSYHTVVLRRSRGATEALEKETFRNIGPRGNNGVKCTEEADSTGVARGTFKDCTVSLKNGDFYVSFYHFATTFLTVAKDKCEPVEFTVYVRNASPQGSTPNVSVALRDLVSKIRIPSTIHAASQ